MTLVVYCSAMSGDVDWIVVCMLFVFPSEHADEKPTSYRDDQAARSIPNLSIPDRMSVFFGQFGWLTFFSQQKWIKLVPKKSFRLILVFWFYDVFWFFRFILMIMCCFRFFSLYKCQTGRALSSEVRCARRPSTRWTGFANRRWEGFPETWMSSQQIVSSFRRFDVYVIIRWYNRMILQIDSVLFLFQSFCRWVVELAVLIHLLLGTFFSMDDLLVLSRVVYVRMFYLLLHNFCCLFGIAEFFECFLLCSPGSTSTANSGFSPPAFSDERPAFLSLQGPALRPLPAVQMGRCIWGSGGLGGRSCEKHWKDLNKWILFFWILLDLA